MSASGKAAPGLIVGDVETSTDVRVNTKGGSLTAILKKNLREQLGAIGETLAGAALRFGGGETLLLLSNADAAPGGRLRVLRVGKNRFEIELDSDTDDEVDGLTAAFLRVKQQQFVDGSLELMPPIGADQWRAEMEARLAEGAAAAQSLHKSG